ncbi:MAG: phosphonate C-P lyase system protein PhnL [Candidatus Adiutrix sp.]|jgi:alpha-D-ribose 1-methylphosphonate 5-triphosphate synthase subunit PhnL|nr:phosphonate C-P lyase system protein PhnL [Candidatus Adiutrix sp.]
MPAAMIKIENISKTFTLHQQGGVRLKALEAVSLTVEAGECLAVNGPSGAGKSSLLRCVYGNYLTDSGRISIVHQGQNLEINAASPRQIMAARLKTMAYVSQFLAVIPRVSALNIVAEPLIKAGEDPKEAAGQAAELLGRLNIPRRLWAVAPATFSGGERQRVNIARGFVKLKPILLLDEPTASLDKANRRVVRDLIEAAKERGAAIMGIFHDDEIRNTVADREHLLVRPDHESEN